MDENGVVTAVAAGETTITVENSWGKTTCNVVVKREADHDPRLAM
ncbi:MAG: hypothetical protein ACLSB9_21505 [Hydrogeniiclostridium mannosilyticum]